MRKPIFLILFVSYVLFSNAQDANQAMDFLLNKNYPAAQEEYDKLYNESPQELEYLYYSAVCDLKLKNENSAIDKLNKILAPVRKNPKASRAEYNVSMLLAECYHNIYMFDQELTIYSRLLKKEFKRKEEKTIRLKIKQANDAKKLFMEFKQIVVTQLAIINSKYDDHTPIPDSSGQRIFFTSKRKGSTGGELSPEGKFYEDIYVWNRNLGLWSKPYNIGPPINTAAHEATAGVSLSGNTLFIFKAGKKNPGDLYVSYRTDTVWSKPVKLGKNVNKKYSREQHAALSPDENTLYFTSDRRRGEGGSDIWISGKEDDGSWGKPENAPFNTEFDEGAPFIFNNGKTIYFSSKGYAGMGGFDVYKSEQKEDGTWSEPENIGFPINTVDDDIFYFPAGNENIAYFTRRKGGSANIYKAQLYGEYEMMGQFMKPIPANVPVALIASLFVAYIFTPYLA
ncbi:MAG: hypothetical protein U9N85_05225, partial [Bacteroidota bacterium]|nr:hypothetical protein [Bacteroidota bacterium]